MNMAESAYDICNIVWVGVELLMDWRSVTFDWNRARAFLVTAEEGSLAAAARALNMSQPTLSRQVAALEKELGVALFERVGRGLELTPNGLDLVEHVRTMGDAANRLSLTASGRSSSLEGTIAITAPEVMAAVLLPPLILKLRRMEPGIHIEIIASDSESNLNRREADIAIRGFCPTQPELIGRKLYTARGHLYAAPAYLEKLAQPVTPDALNKAEFIDFDNSGRLRTMLNERGLQLSPRNFPVATNNSILQWELIKAGVAIGIMSEEIGDAEPRVQRVLPEMEALTGEIWLVAHRELRTNRRVRFVFDFLAKEIAGYYE